LLAYSTMQYRRVETRKHFRDDEFMKKANKTYENSCHFRLYTHYGNLHFVCHLFTGAFGDFVNSSSVAGKVTLTCEGHKILSGGEY